MLQMHPDLMGPPRLRQAFQHRKSPLLILKSPLHHKSRLARLPLRMHRLPHPDLTRLKFPLPPQPTFHRQLIPLRPAPHHRLISLLDLPSPHHLPQLPRHLPRLRHQNTPARLPIQPIHKKELLPRHRLLQHSQQSHLIRLARRMHDQRCRLPHHQPILILLQHLKIRPRWYP